MEALIVGELLTVVCTVGFPMAVLRGQSIAIIYKSFKCGQDVIIHYTPYKPRRPSRCAVRRRGLLSVLLWYCRKVGSNSACTARRSCRAHVADLDTLSEGGVP